MCSWLVSSDVKHRADGALIHTPRSPRLQEFSLGVSVRFAIPHRPARWPVLSACMHVCIPSREAG